MYAAPVVPAAIVKMFSSSAATGLVLDLFKEYGPDSKIGMITSIMMSCTETIFYTMSVYYMAGTTGAGSPKGSVKIPSNPAKKSKNPDALRIPTAIIKGISWNF